jgi:hypothetical protein
MIATASKASYDEQLAADLAEFYADPLGFVLYAYPWGIPGTALANEEGPDVWQRELLEEIGEQVRERGFDGVNAVTPIREAVASGHGIGKSTIIAWIADWIRSTRPYSRGTVTANTFVQLETKTWAAIQRWAKLSVTASWWKIGADRISHKQHSESWFLSAQTCKEENSEAFAGQHAKDSTSYYLFDEASNIPESIWTVAEGGLKTGESHFYAFGNPTRRSGAFFRICFGSDGGRWKIRSIDSRTSKFTNHDEIDEDIKQHGIDSDIIRVRVRGLPPSASDLQFIDSNRVYEAQRRLVIPFSDDPLILGCDLARGGKDECCFRFRRGLDARTLKPVRLSGQESRDSMMVATKIALLLRTPHLGSMVRMCFIDDTGGFGVADRLKQLGYRNIVGVQFGGEAPERGFANMRVWMWDRMKDWLLRGAIDSLPALEIDLTGPGFKHDKQDRLLLESKEDMKRRLQIGSPDDGDALALTFAAPVAPLKQERKKAPAPNLQNGYPMISGDRYGWMGN